MTDQHDTITMTDDTDSRKRTERRQQGAEGRTTTPDRTTISDTVGVPDTTAGAEGTTADPSRRRLLRATAGLTLASGLVGCLSLGDGSPAGDGDGDGNGGGTATDTPTTTFEPDCDSPETLSRSDTKEGGAISKGCYEAETTLPVQSGTLTLEAGAWIKFPENEGLDVGSDAGLRAKGTGTAPVVLTGTKETRGHWAGIRFNGSNSGANVLENTVVEYAGGSQWHGGGSSRAGVFLQGESTVEFDGGVLRENGQAGIVAGNAKMGLALSDTVFEANELPAWVNTNLAGAFSPDNSFEGNDDDFVKLGVGGARDGVNTEQTWQDSGVPFQLTRTAVLNAAVTIAEGATFRFKKQAGLDVAGSTTLTVEGSEDAPVTFTGVDESRGSWKGIRFKNSQASENVVENAVIEYAGDSQWHGGGSSQAGIFVQGRDVSLTVGNSMIRENSKVAVTAGDGRSDLTLEGNTFEENGAPLWLDANLVGGVAESNTFQNNDDSYVFVGVGGARTGVGDEQTWQALDVPYRPTRTVSVGAPLEISPSTTFEFEQNAGIKVHDEGRLMADASGGDQIVFSGTEQITGFWKGLYFINSLSSDNVLRNVVIEYGGSSGWHGGPNSVANLFLRGGVDAAAVSISDSTVRGSGKYGISMEDKARVMDCSGTTFENNTAADTYNSATDAPISNCQ